MPTWLIVVITFPVITAFIGWLTNWSAIKMIFEPREFIGVGRVGWQGVVPAQADRFATDVAATITGELLSARDLTERIPREDVLDLLDRILDEYADDVVREATEELRPGLWAEWDPAARQMVVELVRTQVAEIAGEIVGDVEAQSDELLDLHHLVVSMLSGENVDRLLRVFRTLGRRELRFIEYYGAVFGGLVGLFQALLFAWANQWWLLPIVGAVVGLGTNYLAIQMIFRPQEPRRYLGLVTYQGTFPKRQGGIAHEFGEVIADEIFTPRNVLRFIAEGEGGRRIAAVVLQQVDQRIETMRPGLEALTQAEVTPEVVSRVQALVVLRVIEAAPEVQPHVEAFVTERLGVAELVEQKLAALPKPEFERVLRGIFEEDEVTLIAIGAVLGGVVGSLQGALTLAL